MRRHSSSSRPLAWRDDATLNELDLSALSRIESIYGPRRRPAPVAPAAPKTPDAAAAPRAKRRSRARGLALVALLVSLALVAIDSPYAPALFEWADQQVAPLLAGLR